MMIKRIREKSGMTQTEAAKKLKINIGFWCRVESGKIGLPPCHFHKASKLFKVPLTKLVNLRVRQFEKKLRADISAH